MKSLFLILLCAILTSCSYAPEKPSPPRQLKTFKITKRFLSSNGTLLEPVDVVVGDYYLKADGCVTVFKYRGLAGHKVYTTCGDFTIQEIKQP